MACAFFLSAKSSKTLQKSRRRKSLAFNKTQDFEHTKHNKAKSYTLALDPLAP